MFTLLTIRPLIGLINLDSVLFSITRFESFSLLLTVILVHGFVDASVFFVSVSLWQSGHRITHAKVSRRKPPDFLSIPINIDLLSGSLLHSQFDSTFKKLSELFLSSLLLSGLTQNVCTAQKG